MMCSSNLQILVVAALPKQTVERVLAASLMHATSFCNVTWPEVQVAG